MQYPRIPRSERLRWATAMADVRDETVLVTGGSGFLGGWCVIELLRRGYTVRTTVRSLSREDQVRAAVGSEVDPGDRLTVLAADLTSDDGWPEAVNGCDYVLHVASPFPPKQPKDPDELIVPARDGTLRVLAMSLDAGVKRVVLTSSVAAIRLAEGAPVRPLDETDWTDPDSPGLTPYVRSKTIAELAAWEMARERGAEDRLAVVNPGAIIGPVLNDDVSYSLQAVQRLLDGSPGVPQLGFSLVDVRDVADLELRAMTSPEAGGQRFIAATKFLWMADIGAVLRERLGDRASKVPTRTIPNLLVRAMALFDPGIRSVVGGLGKRSELSSEKARSSLGWSPRPIEDTITETGETLIRHGAAAPRPSASGSRRLVYSLAIPHRHRWGGTVAVMAPGAFDVVVVGASIGGCTAARLFALSGARVALIERRPDPDAYKVVCTHQILSSAVPTMDRLGLTAADREAGRDPQLPRRLDAVERVDRVPRRRPARVRRHPANARPAAARARRGYAGRGSDGRAHGDRPARRRRPPGRREVAKAPTGAAQRIGARLVVAADGRGSTVARLARVPGRVRPHNRFFYFAYWRGLRPVTNRARVWFLDPEGAAAFPNEDDLTVLAAVPHRSRMAEFRADPEGFLRAVDRRPPGRPRHREAASGSRS